MYPLHARLSRLSLLVILLIQYIVFVAGGQPPLSTVLINSCYNRSLSVASNVTLARSPEYVFVKLKGSIQIPTSTSTLPPDPWPYCVPHTSQIVTFYGYNRSLDVQDIFACLLAAANAVIGQLSTGGDTLIGAAQLQTQSDHVRLVLRPRRPMTWAMFGVTIQALTNFVRFLSL